MTIRTNTLPFFLSALAAAGCTQEIEGGGPSGEVVVGEGSEALQIAFEDFFSETGRIRIYRNVKGEVSLSVMGAIGKDDPTAIGKLVDPSFVVTYQNLRHGVAKVPDRLVALEKERIPTHMRPAEMLRAEMRSPEMRPPELPLEGEDQTSFWNSTCRWFCNLMGSNGTEWVAQACPFVANDTWVHVAFDDPDQSVDPYWANASFFWNMTSGGAHHTLWNATAHYNNYPIPPFTWGWDTWPAADPRGYPFLTKDSGSGELGTTAHWPWFGGCR